MRYDCVIIGAGPAGMEAALTLRVRNKNILIFGKPSKKVLVDHPIENYLGLPNILGTDLNSKMMEHLALYGTSLREEKIHTVYAMGDYFNIQTTKNEMIEASSVILATGVSMAKPFKGEEEFLGRGVSYCATCDGNFYKGKDVAVVGYSKDFEDEVKYLATLVSHVYYIPYYDEVGSFSNKVEIIRDRVMSINGEFKVKSISLENNDYFVSGVFILRESVLLKSLVPGLELDNNHIKVDRMMSTNIPGVFAAGDITGEPYQYIKAAGEGNVAAISCVKYLNKIN